MKTQKDIAKKLIIIYVLNVLRSYSKPDVPISQTAICTYLNDIGVFCDRKTVGRNIEYLTEFGYPIRRIKGKGCYLLEEDIKNLKSKIII